MSDERIFVRMTVNGRKIERRVEFPPAVGGFPAQRIKAHRRPYRMRPRRLRRLHRLDQWTHRTKLHCVCRANGRRQHRDGRIVGRQRRAIAVAGSFPRAPCTAVRILHAWILMTANQLLKQNPDPTEQQIRRALAGNLCRCTGYVNIVRAVKAAARKIRAAADAAKSAPAASSAQTS